MSEATKVIANWIYVDTGASSLSIKDWFGLITSSLTTIVTLWQMHIVFYTYLRNKHAVLIELRTTLNEIGKDLYFKKVNKNYDSDNEDTRIKNIRHATKLIDDVKFNYGESSIVYQLSSYMHAQASISKIEYPQYRHHLDEYNKTLETLLATNPFRKIKTNINNAIKAILRWLQLP
jgi:hypothetical protein